VSEQIDVFAPRKRTAKRHAAHVQRLVPLAQELALRAGSSGITAGDIRLAAEQRGLLDAFPKDRRLSWLWAVPKAAGLQRTNQRRLCPQSRTRNDHIIYVMK